MMNEEAIEQVKTLNKMYANAKVVNGYIVGNPWDDGIVSLDDDPCGFQFDFPIWGVSDDDERIKRATNSETSDIFKTLVFENSANLNANYALFVYVPKEDNTRVRLEVFTTRQEIADYLECYCPLLELESEIIWKEHRNGRELTSCEKNDMMVAVGCQVCRNIHATNELYTMMNTWAKDEKARERLSARVSKVVRKALLEERIDCLMNDWGFELEIEVAKGHKIFFGIHPCLEEGYYRGGAVACSHYVGIAIEIPLDQAFWDKAKKAAA